MVLHSGSTPKALPIRLWKHLLLGVFAGLAFCQGATAAETTLTLEEAFQAKFRNKDYIKWLNESGIPKGVQSYPEEQWIKDARSRLAAQVQPPDDAEIIEIPLQRGVTILIDGALDESAWTNAFAKPIGRDEMQATLLLISDGVDLFIACDAKDEKTDTGYDQFRFYWHLSTSPLIVNERIHVGTSKSPTRVLRQTTLKPPGRRIQLTDWNVSELAEGVSALADHRRYEVRLDLQESGLHVGIPFAARVEVETDPLKLNGKFLSRVTLGEWGSQKKPIWFRIGKPAPASIPARVPPP